MAFLPINVRLFFSLCAAIFLPSFFVYVLCLLWDGSRWQTIIIVLGLHKKRGGNRNEKNGTRKYASLRYVSDTRKMSFYNHFLLWPNFGSSPTFWSALFLPSSNICRVGVSMPPLASYFFCNLASYTSLSQTSASKYGRPQWHTKLSTHLDPKKAIAFQAFTALNV